MNIPTPWGPIHWCPHETMAIVGFLPFILVFWVWVVSKFKKHDKHCHAEHTCCEPKDKKI